MRTERIGQVIRMNFEQRLAQLGLVLPEAPVAPGAFVGARLIGNRAVVSGQVPLRDGKVTIVGRLGDDVSEAQGQEAARCCLLNALAQIAAVAGSCDSIDGFERLGGYVAATEDFRDHGKIIDAASSLLRALFPDRWEHARVALGMSSLPRGVPVEIELTAILRRGH